MFVLIFVNWFELWWYCDLVVCVLYIVFLIWLSVFRNLFDGDVCLGGGGGLGLIFVEIRLNRLNSFVSFKEGLYKF